MDKPNINLMDYPQSIKGRTIQTYSTILVGLGAKDYNPASVIAELIDNAIPQDGKDINTNITENELSILDDGMGQDKKGVEDALDLGKLNSDPSSQSVYGLGIKQIWAFLGDRVTIASKKSGEDTVHVLTLSIKEILTNYTFLNQIPIDAKEVNSYVINGEEYCNKGKHFWHLRVSDLKNKNLRLYLTKRVFQTLSLTYQPYILDGLQITLNGTPLKKIPEPKLTPLPSFQNKTKIDFDMPSWGMKGWWGIIEKHTKSGGTSLYGADTYHNARMITHADRHILGIGDVDCKIAEHPSQYRLKCRVYFTTPSILDKSKVSNKNNWIKNDEYYKVQDFLFTTVTQKYQSELKRVISSEDKAEQDEYNDAISKTANPYMKEAFPEFTRPHIDYKRRKGKIPAFEETEQLCEIRTQTDKETEENPENGEFKDKQVPQDPHFEERPHIPIYINNIPYNIEIVNTFDYALDDNRYLYTKDDVNHVITLFINENRKDVINLDAEQRIPLILEWLIEVAIRLTMPRLSSTDFISERETRLQKVEVEKWHNDIIAWVKKTRKASNTPDGKKLQKFKDETNKC